VTESDRPPWPFPWPADAVARYDVHRAGSPPVIDGRLDEPAWQEAPRSPSFRDLVSGAETRYATEAAVLWDDTNLYVGFWIAEPDVTATLTERDSLVWTDDDVEVFVAGRDAYYELEVNAFGTIYEALFVWDDAYERDGYAGLAGLEPGAPGHRPFDGVGFRHPRGGRQGFFGWDLPGLAVGVAVDGTINDPTDVDRGWTVEIALPWSGLEVLGRADGRSVPPRPGDVWRMDFSRFNTRTAPPVPGRPDDSGGWAWSPHGVWDSHVPELFPHLHFLP